MNSSNNDVQGKPDSVDVRAAEIAKREGRGEVTNEDRELAYEELRKMGAPAAKPTP